MKFSFGRLGAVLRKELREYRRSPFIVGTMAVLPLVFLIEPLITIFRIGPSAKGSTVDAAVGVTFTLLLVAPALLPAVIAAYSVVGEREQGTLEPLLTTPLRREELLLGKALGVVVPAVGIAYVLFAVIQICARLFASNAAVVAALGQGPHILAEILFAPLLAGWSIWVGIGISTRASDVRVAQQLGRSRAFHRLRSWPWCPSTCSLRASPSQWCSHWSCSWPTSFCFASSRRYSTASDSSQALGLSDSQVVVATSPRQVLCDIYRA